jgi:hypothetical protein
LPGRLRAQANQVYLTEEEGSFVQSKTYSADILGSGILIPEYADNPVVLPGMAFSRVVSEGVTDYRSVAALPTLLAFFGQCR